MSVCLYVGDLDCLILQSCGIFGAESAPRRLASFVAGHLVYNVFMVLVIILDVIHPAAGEKYHIPQLE